MKQIIEHQDQLEQVATISRSGVFLIDADAELDIRGKVEITQPLKFSGTSTIRGEDGSCLHFVNKGSLSCSKRAERLTLKGVVLRSELERPVFHIDRDTANTLILQDVVVDAFGLGKCLAQRIAMVNCQFLNGYQSPMALGDHVMSLVVSGVRHDSDQCLLDISGTEISHGFITDNYIKDGASGLFLNDDNTHIHKSCLYIANTIGLANPLDIFRTKTKAGKLTSVDYSVSSCYVI